MLGRHKTYYLFYIMDCCEKIFDCFFMLISSGKGRDGQSWVRECCCHSCLNTLEVAEFVTIQYQKDYAGFNQTLKIMARSLRDRKFEDLWLYQCCNYLFKSELRNNKVQCLVTVNFSRQECDFRYLQMPKFQKIVQQYIINVQNHWWSI